MEYRPLTGDTSDTLPAGDRACWVALTCKVGSRGSKAEYRALAGVTSDKLPGGLSLVS